MSNIKSKISGIFSWILNKRKNQKNITVLIFSQLYILFLTFCVTFFIFKLLTNFETSTTDLLFSSDGLIPRFLVSYLIILIICEFLYLVTFFLYTPLFIVYPVISLAGIANVAKINFRNEPVVFTDLLLFKETIDIASEYPLDLPKYLPFLLSVFILLIILPLFLRRVKFTKFNIIKRVISGGAALLITVPFFAYTLVAENTLIEKAGKSLVWNLADEYKQNGFVIEFMWSIKRSIIFAPDGYNKNNVREYALELGYPEDYKMPELNKTQEELPNIIVIMNESYWDTANLTGIAFNKDPLESVRGIMEKNGGISLLSPQLGGGTSNVEFEFLTGKNSIYYPPSGIVYQQFITKKHWSLAWHFRDLGYATTAIHPYHDWFWKRNTVYPLLGFENMYFNDGKSLHYIDTKGGYISDKAVSDEIISRYKMFSEDGGRPVFTFAVTMQNHGPYYAKYFGDDKKIKLINQIYGEHSVNLIETFAEGLRFSSEAFIYLTEYFKDTERPTYIIMFGDHAPSGIADMAEYYALDENAAIPEESHYNKFVTPLIVWSNQNNPETDEIIRNIGTVTPQMLTNEIFNITGMPKPAYIEMLENIKKTTRGFTGRYMLDGIGAYNRTNDFESSETIKDIYEKLRIVQYDATLGKNYFIDEFESR